MDNSYEYKWNFPVNSFDTDAKRDIRLASLMSYNQEAGNRALEKIGADYVTMYEKNVVLVFTHISVEFFKMPKLGDVLHLDTWHRCGKGMLFYRDTEIFNESGEMAVGMTIVCCCMDPHTRRALRPSALTQFGITSDPNRLPVHRQPDRHIKMPEGMKYCGKHTIRYTDLDYNVHMNNAFYANLCLDFMPGSMHEKRIQFFSINYISESREGDEVKIYACAEENKVWFYGDNPRGRSFDVYLEYEPVE